jgi:NTP pyrophosphatase (non-canonical NTP hydrolase)
MDFNEYQNLTEKTDLKTGIKEGLNPPFLYYVLGLVGEAGEVADKIKKIFRDDKGVITDEKIESINKELGDVLWYLSRLANAFNLKFNDVAKSNINKLFKRKNNGTIIGSGDNR